MTNAELAHRHVRLGWTLVLSFMLLGTTLEFLHGFKVGWYLDLANATRRHVWTLAHAHGTLLGLVHLGFAATVRTRGETPAWPRLSLALTLGTLLVPLGFFLGGFGIEGGDPGLAVLLVPLGALISIGALAGILIRAWPRP